MRTMLNDPAVLVPARRESGLARRVIAGVILPAATLGVAAAGLKGPVPAGLPGRVAVAYCLALAGALSAAVLGRDSRQTPLWQVAAGSLVASVALTGARIGAGSSGDLARMARGITTLAVPVLIAISVHLLLALPDGRLGGGARKAGAVAGLRRGGRGRA